MPFLLLKDLPRYECLLESAKLFPDMDPSACEAMLHLLRAGDEVVEISQAHLAEHHVSQGRFGVLMLLWASSHRGSGTAAACAGKALRTPAQLAEAASVTRATMTGLIDTLERDGLVRREKDPADRRMMSVVLTPAGHSFLRGILPGHFRLMAQMMRGLSEAERKTLVRLLHKILQQSGEIARKRSRHPTSSGSSPR